MTPRSDHASFGLSSMKHLLVCRARKQSLHTHRSLQLHMFHLCCNASDSTSCVRLLCLFKQAPGLSLQGAAMVAQHAVDDLQVDLQGMSLRKSFYLAFGAAGALLR